MDSANSSPTLKAWPHPGAAPRYATAPTPGRPHAGDECAELAALIGRPFMPWQRYVADVATERLPDPSRCGACAGVWDSSAHVCPYAYPVVVVSVPRQSGKTLLLFVILLQRCVRYEGHQAFYTAQTGKDARDRWRDMVKLITRSPLRGLPRVRYSQGSERMEFSNGSELRVFAPTADSLHGYTPPTVCLDESFAHTEDEGDALMGAIEPAQQTLPHRQLWVVSTRGTASSVFLDRWIESGLAGAAGVALFDWGAADHHDPRDPADLLEFHPALGLPDGMGNGTTAEGILSSKLPASEYERAYGNRATVTESHTISTQAWSDLAGVLEAPPADTPLTLTYDVAYDRTAATIGVTWRDPAGHLCHKLVRWQLGVSWVALEVAELCRRWGTRVAVVAGDDTGPAREVTAQLRAMHSTEAPRVARDPRILTTREVTVAWGGLLESIRDQSFRHCGDGHLSDAAAAVVPRPVLDAAAPSRRYSPGDIAPLVCCMVGLHLAAGAVLEDQTPLVRFA